MRKVSITITTWNTKINYTLCYLTRSLFIFHSNYSSRIVLSSLSTSLLKLGCVQSSQYSLWQGVASLEIQLIQAQKYTIIPSNLLSFLKLIKSFPAGGLYDIVHTTVWYSWIFKLLNTKVGSQYTGCTLQWCLTHCYSCYSFHWLRMDFPKHWSQARPGPHLGNPNLQVTHTQYRLPGKLRMGGSNVSFNLVSFGNRAW